MFPFGVAAFDCQSTQARKVSPFQRSGPESVRIMLFNTCLDDIKLKYSRTYARRKKKKEGKGREKRDGTPLNRSVDFLCLDACIVRVWET